MFFRIFIGCWSSSRIQSLFVHVVFCNFSPKTKKTQSLRLIEEIRCLKADYNAHHCLLLRHRMQQDGNAQTHLFFFYGLYLRDHRTAIRMQTITYRHQDANLPKRPWHPSWTMNMAYVAMWYQSGSPMCRLGTYPQRARSVFEYEYKFLQPSNKNETEGSDHVVRYLKGVAQFQSSIQYKILYTLLLLRLG